MCQAVELQGYGRVGDNTYPNVMALLTGMLANERPAGEIDKAPFLWKPFSEVGYRTLHLEDSFIDNHVFNIWVGKNNDPGGFLQIPTDYYYRPMSVAQHHEPEAISNSFFSPTCIGPTFETDFILNWVQDSGVIIRINLIRVT